MKKFAVVIALAIVCGISTTIPNHAKAGVIYEMKGTPTPTPTPPVEIDGRSASANSSRTLDEIPSFWDFLGYFGL